MLQPIDIEALVSWTLNEQAADKVVRLQRSAGPSGGYSGTSAVCETLALGAIVDRQGAHVRALGAKCHPDAVVVLDAIEWLEGDEWSLVVSHGKTRSRPDWELWPEISPLRHPKNGKVVVERTVDERTGKVLAQWCPLDIRPSLDVVRAGRDRYRDWHRALTYLRGCLTDGHFAGHLAAYLPTGPAAPAVPWISTAAS